MPPPEQLKDVLRPYQLSGVKVGVGGFLRWKGGRSGTLDVLFFFIFEGRSFGFCLLGDWCGKIFFVGCQRCHLRFCFSRCLSCPIFLLCFPAQPTFTIKKKTTQQAIFCQQICGEFTPQQKNPQRVTPSQAIFLHAQACMLEAIIGWWTMYAMAWVASLLMTWVLERLCRLDLCWLRSTVRATSPPQPFSHINSGWLVHPIINPGPMCSQVFVVHLWSNSSLFGQVWVIWVKFDPFSL